LDAQTKCNKYLNTIETFKKATKQEALDICANSLIKLIKFTIFFLSRQIKTLQQAFINEGGLIERMTQAR
jgi:four helix bundle suffix protein